MQIIGRKQVSLYFHIPFCTKKCPYCHFYVVPNLAQFHTVLEEGLFLEWERQLPLLLDKEIVSIYFGGGTPTLFPKGVKKLLDKVFATLSVASDCEITIEANPEDGSEELFEELLSYRVNRLSVGVQSLDDRSLHTLERIHSAQKAKATLLQAEKAGFKNISIDLMYDLPDQTQSSWLYTLGQARELPLQHLSLYNLTIEPHTAFHKRKIQIPSTANSLVFLQSAIETFESMGLKRYEISAFAKTGFQSRHNLGYWTYRPFLGFGPSAFSYWEGERFQNLANLQRYTRTLKMSNSPIDFRETLPYPQNVKEKLAVGLRLIDGIDMDLPEELHKTIKELIDQNLLVRKNLRICLSEKGLLFHDTVASQII